MCIKENCAFAICLGGCSQGARSGVAPGFLGFTYYPMHGTSAVLLGHHGGCSHDGVLSGGALGCHSKWCLGEAGFSNPKFLRHAGSARSGIFRQSHIIGFAMFFGGVMEE